MLLFLTFFGAVVVALICGIAFHEFSHAFTADRLGDGTARAAGRVSLNPVRHLDPAGTVFLMIGGFGWGKPVPVNPWRLRNGPKNGRAMVAAAGPLSNILLAALASLPMHLGLVDWRSPFLVPSSVSGWSAGDYAGLFLGSLIIFNVVLAVFNLLPIAPLDGFAVAVGLLPSELSTTVARLEPYGPGILMLLIVMPFVAPGQVSLLHEFMSPLINGLTDLIAGGGRALR
ncbi:MAG: site-2 protease family protein [Dehalococcoidia bacterium]|nr:site-2 protease family protein [Dehalococcoidia bacterium]